MMKKEYEDFLLEEYGKSRILPTKISIGQYDFLVPYAYANPVDNTAFEKALFHKYQQAQTAEMKKYKEKGYTKIPMLHFTDTVIVMPYRLRTLSPEEAKNKIADEIYKRYNKAVRLAMALKQACPKESYPVKVDEASVKELDAAYNKYLQDTFQDKALVAAVKMNRLSRKNFSTAGHTFSFLSVPLFRMMNKQYLKQLNRLKSILQKNHDKLTAFLGTTSLAGALTFGVYKICQQKTPEKIENTLEILATPSCIADIINDTATKIEAFSSRKGVKTTIDASALNNNVKNFLKERGFNKLNSVQAHNLDMYLKTRELSNNFIAFAEDFHSEVYDDKKGFLTIGYGCTNYLDEHGNPWEKVGKTGKKSAFVQEGQTTTKMQAMNQVNYVSDFTILPKILDLVKVKLDEKQMIVTKNFAFITNTQFEETKYLQALNDKRSNEYLSQCMALWKVDAGLPKRIYVLHLILTGKLDAGEIQKFKPASCYSLSLDQCLACYKNPDGTTKMKDVKVVTTEIIKGRKKKVVRIKTRPVYKMKNGLPYFISTPQNIQTCINMMKAQPHEPCVAQIVPPSNLRQNIYVQTAANRELLSMYRQQKTEHQK